MRETVKAKRAFFKMHLDGLRILVGAAALVAVCGGAAAAEWYSGGTLHKANMAEWRNASPANRLATTSDWLVAYMGEKLAMSIFPDGLKALSQQVVICVNGSVEGLEGLDNQMAGSLGVACMMLMEIPQEPR